MTRQTLILFTCLNLLNYFDRYLVNALLPLIREDFGLNYEQSGRVVAAFVFGYFLSAPLFGYLGDRFRRPYLLAFGVAVWCAATLATGLAAGTLMGFVLARVCVGIGEASFATVAPGYLKDRVQDETKVTAVFSWFYAAIPVGSALAWVVSARLLEYMSWPSVFFIGAVPGFLFIHWLLKQPEAERGTSPESLPFRQAVKALKSPVLALAIIGYVLNAFALSGIAAFVNQYGVEIGFTLQAINDSFGIILVVTGLIGTLAGAKLCDWYAGTSARRVRRMLEFITIGAILGVPCMGLAFQTVDHSLFLVLCAVAQLAIFAGVAPINAIIVTECDPKAVTFVQGVSIFSMNLFGTLMSPWLIGILADVTSLSTALQLSTGALLLCAVTWGAASRFAKGEEH